jgi:hypothetical protein
MYGCPHLDSYVRACISYQQARITKNQAVDGRSYIRDKAQYYDMGKKKQAVEDHA